MIRINLLPVRKVRQRNTSIYHLAAMASAVAFTLLLALGTHLFFQSRLGKQQKLIADNDSEVQRLNKIIGDVKEAEKQKTRLTNQLAVIEKLQKGKRGPVHVLDELTNAIPKRVWLTNFKESSGALSMTGAAIDNADISEFLRALQKSPYFSEVLLKFTQADVRDGVSIFNFEIACKVNYAA